MTRKQHREYVRALAEVAVSDGAFPRAIARHADGSYETGYIDRSMLSGGWWQREGSAILQTFDTVDEATAEWRHIKSLDADGVDSYMAALEV